MKEFYFSGEIPSSKSILNRALIAKSYFPKFSIHGESTCNDVLHMKAALPLLNERSLIDCGEGGTTFRFLALRASRIAGEHFLRAHSRLMHRPQQELVEILKQLGVQALLQKEGLAILSQGWKKPKKAINIDSTNSSQYASALLLNSWLLDFDLEFQRIGNAVSSSYFEMTLELMTQLGMQVQKSSDQVRIPKQQNLKQLTYAAEPDLSSAFVFAAAGALAGHCEIFHFPEQSLQPDRVFIEIFQKMNIPCQRLGSKLVVSRTENIQAQDINLGQAPDLFPVLAVICSFANGTSKLYGAPHLALKESNRIEKVSDLLNLIDIKHEILSDGMIIHGQKRLPSARLMMFDPHHDHRMVMAAALLKKMGHAIKILNPESVNKSIPEFFSLFGVHP